MKKYSPEISIKLHYKDVKLPERAFPTDSGLDLYIYKFDKLFTSENPEGVIPSEDTDSLSLPSMGRVLINTGISATIDVGYELQIRPRSGLALNHGLTVLNTPGTVDESYRGIIGVIIINLSGVTQVLTKGKKIAQMVACPVALLHTAIVDDLDSTERSSGGFGHTGN